MTRKGKHGTKVRLLRTKTTIHSVRPSLEEHPHT